MSLTSEESIKCPQCGKESTMTMFRTIDMQTSPNLKAKVLNGEIFQFQCPHCHYKGMINYGLLYEDVEKHLMVYYAKTEEEYNNALQTIAKNRQDKAQEGDEVQKMMAQVAKEFSIRVVRSQGDMAEKVAIAEAGYDDRLIELLKVFWGNQALQQGIRFDHAYFVRGKGTQLDAVQLFDSQTGQSRAIEFNKSVKKVYDTFLAKFYPILQGEHGNDVEINFSWAVSIFKEMAATAKA